MPHLLHLDSAIPSSAAAPGGAPARSRSREVTAAFADAWAAQGEAFTTTRRDLAADPPPHLADSVLHWAPPLRPAGAAVDPAAEALQAELLAELLAADVLLVGAPMYNYSLPSTLKAWVDNVHVPGTTTPFGDLETQPLAGRPAVVVSSRGGTYDAGTPTEAWDHTVPPLRIVLGDALGMDVAVITTSATLAEDVAAMADQVDRSRAELARAQEEAVALARQLGAVAAGRPGAGASAREAAGASL